MSGIYCKKCGLAINCKCKAGEVASQPLNDLLVAELDNCKELLVECGEAITFLYERSRLKQREHDAILDLLYRIKKATNRI